jgi:SAM-dependent methyltransferase
VAETGKPFLTVIDTPPSIHHAAAEGFAAGADLYARGRPEYPDEISAWLRDGLGLHPGNVAIDLGAGSGKFTGSLLRTGASIIAVEPVPQMREKLARTWPDVPVVEGTAEAIPIPDGAVDAVVCAQAFHWFANAAALREIHRVLKPGGRLGLVWNRRDLSIEWVKELDAIIRRHQGDAPRYANGEWKRVFPFTGFGPMRTAHFRHDHTGTVENVIIDRARSTSFIAALPAEEEGRVVAELRSLIAATPELAGRDSVTMPYVTDVYGMTKVAR